MAEPQAEQLYLPPLEPCLKGETIILSWKLVASALMDPTGHRQSSRSIIDFFNDPSIQSLFTSPGSAFEPSNTKSAHRAIFDKKTAPIHVTPGPNEKYDINIIKDDALWLSKSAGINEVAALRLVVIEHQLRSTNQLLGPISIQDVASLRAAAGAGNIQTANIIPGLSLTATLDASAIRAEFDKPDKRRLRIFCTYLSERRYYAATIDYIFTLMLHGKLPMSPVTDASNSIRNALLEVYGMSTKPSQTSTADIPTKTCHALVVQYVGLLPDCVQRVGENLESVAKDVGLEIEDIQEPCVQTPLTEMLHRMSILFQLIDRLGDGFVSDDVAQKWFSLVNDLTVLNELQGFPTDIADLMIPLQCLVCVISLKVLNLPRMMAFFEGEIDLDTDNEYLASSNALEQIHDVLESSVSSGAAYMAPVLFAWLPIVYAMFSSYQDRAEKRDAIQNQKAVENYDSNTQMLPTAGRRNSAGSITTIDKRRYDDFLINKNLDRDFQKGQNLAMIVTDDIHVFDVIALLASHLGPTDGAIFPFPVGSRMRMAFLDLLKATYPFVGYKSEPLTALLSVLSGSQEYWDIPAVQETSPHDVLSYALDDRIVFDTYIQQALDRFPYEFVPFMALIRALSCSPAMRDSSAHERIIRLLEKTPTLTFTLPEDFTQYYLANEDENMNAFQFADDFPLFSPILARRKITADEELFNIPAGTYGRFIVDEGKIVRVEYEHSALALLGKRLEIKLADRCETALGSLMFDEVAEIISLLATLVRTETLRASQADGKGADSSEAGLAILAEASRALPHNKDIISVICDTMDGLLNEDQDYSGLGALVACVQFLHALLPISPGHVWSYMDRCTLLQNQSHGGQLSRILGNLDLSGVQSDLLMSTTRLFSDLVESAMSSSIRRKTDIKANSRQHSPENDWPRISDKIITQVTLAILQTTMDFLENSSTWRFATDLDRMALIRDIVPIMDRVLHYTFSMDDHTSATAIMSALHPAGKFVVDSFLGPSAGSLRIFPLLGTLVASTQGPESTIYAHRSQVFRDQTLAVLKFATSLVNVSEHLKRSSSALESQLFRIIPYVARLCARDQAFKGPGIKLLESLVVNAGRTVGEPLSLLGSLGPEMALSFLRLLSTLDKPFNQPQQASAIWRFFSKIIRNRQQWMASCLLTGKTPKETRESNAKALETSSSSVLSQALTRIESLSKLEQWEALCILDFITSAQNYWPWTIFTLQKNTNFLAELRRFIHDLKPSSVTAKTNVIQACNEARIAGYVAEIFAMQLFHLRQLGQASALAKELTQDLDYYLRDGVSVSSYNRSLHVNFAQNFNRKYPSCSLDNFKWTLLLDPRPPGDDYCYAISLADKMLKFDPSWIGPRNTGFRNEMEMANKNLSLVDAQVSLYHAWQSLLLELSTCLPNNDNLQKQSFQVAQQCLQANQEGQKGDRVYERVAELRVNLALMLIQRVVQNNPSAGDMVQLLDDLWVAVSSYSVPYTAENITMYRTLLRLLYVTLRALVRSYGQTDLNASVRDSQGNKVSPSAVSQLVLGILDRVVAKGFRTAVALIHDSDPVVVTQDVIIINAILQACLCVPGMDQSQTQILNILATHDAVQTAVSLYSWAHKLAVQGDPIYGELALLFLLELSALPLVAEQLACDGLLDHLTTAKLAAHLRGPHVSPFADSIGLQRCYSIWAKGIVPILLNMLSALSATIAPEVACVLNAFPELMRASVDRFEAPGDDRRGDHQQVTLISPLSVSEIHCLALITQVLGALRANNARDIPAIKWDSAALLENVDWWIDHRKVLRERLVASGAREAEWKSMPASEVDRKRGSESRLEAKVVDQLEVVRLVLGQGLLE